jgi:hypothetical protein
MTDSYGVWNVMPGMRAKGERVELLACRTGRRRCAGRGTQAGRATPVATIHKRHAGAASRQRVVRLPSAGEAAFRRRRARPGPTLVCTGCANRRAG